MCVSISIIGFLCCSKVACFTSFCSWKYDPSNIWKIGVCYRNNNNDLLDFFFYPSQIHTETVWLRNILFSGLAKVGFISKVVQVHNILHDIFTTLPWAKYTKDWTNFFISYNLIEKEAMSSFLI